MERMLDRELLKEIRIQKDIYDLLKSVANELEYNIARLYHLVSGYNLEWFYTSIHNCIWCIFKLYFYYIGCVVYS